MKELRLAESRYNQNLDETNTDTLVVLAEAKGSLHLSIYLTCFLNIDTHGITEANLRILYT